MKQIVIAFLLSLTVVSCTHKSVERKSASTGTLNFECRLVEKPGTRVLVTADAAEFTDVSRSVIAILEIIKDGVVVKHLTNAKIGSRLPPITDGGKTYWAMNLNLGRSGKLYMGYDPIAENWSIAAEMLELNTGSGELADCFIR